MTRQTRRPALAVAALAMLALTTTSAQASTGVGTNFTLGQTNSVNATSTLLGTTSGPQLKVANGNGNQVGIFARSAGGAGPALYGLHASASGRGPALKGYSASTATGATALYALLGSSSPGAGSAAIRAQSNSTGATGYGLWASQAGHGIGVYGSAKSGGGIGVYGRHLGTTGAGPGVRGQSASASGAGVLGVNLAGGPGLQAIVDSGKPPLEVNSSAWVENLNADLLDGLHASHLWKIGGNPWLATAVLGTTNDHPLELEVNGARTLRLEPNATSPNLIGGYSGNSVVDGAQGATIAGGGASGAANMVTDHYGAVGGGENNRAGSADGLSSNGEFATVAGGYQNTASGEGSMVPGGIENTATGIDSFAAGSHARTTSPGSFVWADRQSCCGDMADSGPNTFTARATGGVYFVSGWSSYSGATAGVRLAPGGGSWSSLSDRAAKRDFRPIDRRRLLERLERVPIMRWSYKTQAPSIRHLGPTAQDFRAAFGLGEDGKHIDSIDSGGVALAAIQGLYRQNRALQVRVARLERQIGVLTRSKGGRR